MKKKIGMISLVFGLTLLLSVGAAFALEAQDGTKLSGLHYNLNLLAKDNCPGGDMIESNRHTIFVKLNFSDPDANDILGDNPGNYAALDKTNKILLAPGTDFQVTDGNACNKGGAEFTLPAAVATEWTIWVRELGKPSKPGQPAGGDIALCGVSSGVDEAVGTADDEIVCSTNQVLLMRNTGKSVFRNVTPELTTINYMIITGYDLNGNPIYAPDSATLFDSDFYQYLWDYDNNGLRLVQLRFYPVAQ